jgi:rhomboid protease GluP
MDPAPLPPDDPEVPASDVAPGSEEPQGMTVDELLALITPRAWVTPALAALILIGFGVEIALGVSATSPTGAQLVKAGGQFGPLFADGQWWRAVTSMFLHAGPLHLAFNLWAFWSVGQVTERIFGNRAFLAIYLLSGLGGSLASLAWSPLVVSVGASGAIFGVYGALLAFMLLHRGVFPASYLAAQRNSIVGFIGYNVVFGLSQKNTDMAAHAGGLVIGALAGAMLSRDVLQPAAQGVRRALGAAGIAALIAFSALVVHRRLGEVPAIKGTRLSEAALTHLQAKEYPQAIELYTQALAQDRNHVRLFNRGLAYFAIDDLKSARADIHAADLLESTAKTKAMLCEIGVDVGTTTAEYEEAASYCTGAIQLATTPEAKARLLSIRALVRDHQDRLDEALADADAALALDPSARLARTRRVVVHARKEKLDEAEADCVRLLADADADFFTLHVCARVASKRKDNSASRLRLDRALALAPNDRDALMSRAWLNHLDDRRAEEIADYTKVLTADPAASSAWNNRAWAQIQTGDFAAARNDADHAVSLAPNDASHLGTRCFALAGLGDLVAARADCARAIELGQTSGYDKGMLAFIDKRYDEARRIWQTMSDGDPISARELRPWLARLPKR